MGLSHTVCASGPRSYPDGINATVLGTLSASLLFSGVSVHVKTSVVGRDAPQARACCEVDAKEIKVRLCAVMGELASARFENDPTVYSQLTRTLLSLG